MYSGAAPPAFLLSLLRATLAFTQSLCAAHARVHACVSGMKQASRLVALRPDGPVYGLTPDSFVLLQGCVDLGRTKWWNHERMDLCPAPPGIQRSS